MQNQIQIHGFIGGIILVLLGIAWAWYEYRELKQNDDDLDDDVKNIVSGKVFAGVAVLIGGGVLLIVLSFFCKLV
jgi:hypothetical protein